MNSPLKACRPENPFSRFFKGIDGPRRLNASRSSLPSDSNERRAPCRDMRGRAPPRQAAASLRLAADAPLAVIRAGLVVAATRVGDAAVSVLREGRKAGRQEAEAEERGEHVSEGAFHDPSPFRV